MAALLGRTSRGDRGDGPGRFCFGLGPAVSEDPLKDRCFLLGGGWASATWALLPVTRCGSERLLAKTPARRPNERAQEYYSRRARSHVNTGAGWRSSREFHRAGLAGHLRAGDGRRMAMRGWSARKGLRLRHARSTFASRRLRAGLVRHRPPRRARTRWHS